MTNYARQPIEFQLKDRFAADHRDVFEVRGAKRPRRGDDLPSKVSAQTVLLGYRGLDNHERHTNIEFDGSVYQLEHDRCVINVRLDVGAETTLHAIVSCTNGNS